MYTDAVWPNISEGIKSADSQSILAEMVNYFNAVGKDNFYGITKIQLVVCNTASKTNIPSCFRQGNSVTVHRKSTSFISSYQHSKSKPKKHLSSYNKLILISLSL